MSKKIVKDPVKEQAMLHAAMQLFAQSGYRETKTADVVTAAGVSKGLLFHYFNNKAGVYEACYDTAATFFYTMIDHSIWTESQDLTAMVVNATKYKMEIQLKYPIEFGFLMRAYTEMNQLPEPLGTKLKTKVSKDFSTNVGLMNPVVDRLPLRQGVEREDVILLLNTFLQGENALIQSEISKHPEWQTIEDLEPLIDRIRKSLDIIQFGFVEKKD